MSDTPEIRPALTAEEWERFFRGFEVDLSATRQVRRWGDALRVGQWEGDGLHATELEDPEERYTLAALCLHGQPFGFTWEDVEIIRAALSTWTGMARDDDGNFEYVGDRFDDDRAYSIADRIAALLPPKEE